MKRFFTRKLLFIPCLLIGIISLSCDDDKDKNKSSASTITTSMVSGNWTITRYEDDGISHLGSFDNFRFTFSNDGTVTATDAVVTHRGTWTVIEDDDDDDDNSDLRFNIDFTTPEAFRELSEDWHFVSSSDDQVQLIDVADDNDTDYLTFDKN